MSKKQILQSLENIFSEELSFINPNFFRLSKDDLTLIDGDYIGIVYTESNDVPLINPTNDIRLTHGTVHLTATIITLEDMCNYELEINTAQSKFRSKPEHYYRSAKYIILKHKQSILYRKRKKYIESILIRINNEKNA